MVTSYCLALLACLHTAEAASDTTILLPAATRLDVRSQAGSILVESWDRNEIRIQASYGRGTVVASTSGAVISVRHQVSTGASGAVDYRISVPAGTALDLAGLNTAIQIAGTRATVRASTVQGSVSLRGGSGDVTIESVNGSVSVEGARGGVRARTVSGHVLLRDVQGTVDAQAVSGSIVLEAIASSAVTASTVNGQIFYDGAIAPGGRYRLSTHSGVVTAALPPDIGARITVASFSGTLSSSFPAIAELAGALRNRRQSVTLGDGSAILDLETFSGSIRIVRRGEVAPPATGQRGSPAAPGSGSSGTAAAIPSGGPAWDRSLPIP